MARERNCLYCRQGIQLEQAITACPRCGALYHDACWSSVSACSSEACLASPVPIRVATESLPSAGGMATARLEERLEASDWPPEADATAGREAEAAPRLALERRTACLVRTALPIRVKGGEFGDRAMFLETGAGRVELSWDQVQLICLGIVEENVGTPNESRSGLRSMVRKLFFGENPRDNEPKKKVRDTYLLDVYVPEQRVPYRFDAATVNYRSFFGQVSYISQENFIRLFAQVAYRSRECRFNPSAVALLTAHRDRVRRYATIYDFELDNGQCRDRLEGQASRQEIEIEERLLSPRISQDLEGDPGDEYDESDQDL